LVHRAQDWPYSSLISGQGSAASLVALDDKIMPRKIAAKEGGRRNNV
jgi:hypothetical protein